MSPESLTASDAKPSKRRESNQNERSRTMCLGRSSDVWSLGCILYQILYGRAPFADYPFIQKIGVITNKDTVIQYPETNSAGLAVDKDAIFSMQSCLVHDRRKRAPIAGPKGLLNMSFLAAKSSCQCGVQQCFSTATVTTHTSSNTNNSGSSSDSSASTQKITRTTEPLVLQAIPAFTKKAVPSAASIASLLDKVDVQSTPAKGHLSSSNQVREVFKNLAASSSTPRAISSTINNENNGVGVKSSKSLFANSTKKVRTPLKTLPSNIQQQITSDGVKSNLFSLSATNERAAKWMKPQLLVEKPTMKSVIEEKMASMRMFMCPENDEDNATATRTIDNTGFDFF